MKMAKEIKYEAVYLAESAAAPQVGHCVQVKEEFEFVESTVTTQSYTNDTETPSARLATRGADLGTIKHDKYDCERLCEGAERRLTRTENDCVRNGTSTSNVKSEIKSEGGAVLTSELIIKPDYDAEYKTESALSTETNPSEGRFKCDVCNKLFFSKFDLQRDLMSHFKREQSECEICRKQFSEKSNLRRHRLLHRGENLHRPGPLRSEKTQFECYLCSKRFRLKDTLKRHMLVHSKEKQFECDTCHKQFYRKTHLHEHRLLHSEERPFECHICKTQFKLKSHLKRHFLVHSEEKRFKCDICSKQFRVRGGLRQHMLVHSGKKTFECEQCQKGFKWKSNLLTHARLMHQKQE